MKRVGLIVLTVVISAILIGCGGSGEQGSTKNVEDNIGKIAISDVMNLTLPEAKAALEKEGFSIIISNYDEDNTWPDDKLIVTNQDPTPGTMALPESKITLTCRKLCKLYLDIESDNNLMFNKYDMEITLDGNEIGVVSNGTHFTKLLEVLEGEHTLILYKSGNHNTKGTRTINVDGDMTFISRVDHGGSISFTNTAQSEGVQGASIEIASVENLVLSEAKEVLNQQGFVNVREEPYGDIWNADNWIVTKQSVAAGTILDKNNAISLECIKLSDYLNENYVGKSLDAVQQLAEQNAIVLQYKGAADKKELDQTVASLDEENKKYWVVESAEQLTGKEAVVYLSYLGTPEERAREEELKRLSEELETYFPKDLAEKAIIVAFTNNCAIDVFKEDGNSIDPQKLHGINYSGEFRQSIRAKGEWTPVDSQTWHVENMKLTQKGNNQATKLSCDISYNGENYTVSSVRYMTASPAYIDSEDPAKTSGWMTMEPDDTLYPYLVIPKDYVEGDGGNNTTQASTASGDRINASYYSWLSDQFDKDGSQPDFVRVIKRNLNNPDSFRHIETKYGAALDAETLDQYNSLLKEDGFIEQLEMYDVLLLTTFSSQNAYGMTVNSTALGIMSYNKQTITLVSIA